MRVHSTDRALVHERGVVRRAAVGGASFGCDQLRARRADRDSGHRERGAPAQPALAIRGGGAGRDGTVTDWFVEWSDRNSLVRRGVDLDLIKPGDIVTLTLWPSQRLPNVGYFVQAVLADGSIYRDCGFVQYREAIANSTKFRCEEGTRTAPQRDAQ